MPATSDSLLRPPPYALQIPAFWQSIDVEASDFVGMALKNVERAVPAIDVARMADQLTAARALALSLGVTKCYAFVREFEGVVIILTLTCAVIRVSPSADENNVDLMMRTFQVADGVDFDSLPMMSVLNGTSGEMLRAERVIPESEDRMTWANRVISYGIVHPHRNVMAILVGSTPNLDLNIAGDEFDGIAKSFFWIASPLK